MRLGYRDQEQDQDMYRSPIMDQYPYTRTCTRIPPSLGTRARSCTHTVHHGHTVHRGHDTFDGFEVAKETWWDGFEGWWDGYEV